MNWRRRYPFCVVCQRNKRLKFCDVVDHKLPLRHGGELLDPANVWSICGYHHNGWKAKLEAYAASTGQLDRLIEWCDSPETLPTKLKP